MWPFRGLSLAPALLMARAGHTATLRVGLSKDPDALDPARGGTFVGRVVFAAVCDKLIDTDARSNFVAQLATTRAWSPDNLALTLTLRNDVKFRSGQIMDADAVKANLEHYRSVPESVRKSELRPVSSIEAVDPHTVLTSISPTDRISSCIARGGCGRCRIKCHDSHPRLTA